MSREASRPAHDREEDTTRSQGRLVIVLSIVALLLALAILLLWFLLILPQNDLPAPTVEPTGLESVLVIRGPDAGDTPQFNRPLAAAWGPDDRIYVSDTGNARVCVFDKGGRFVREFGRASAGMNARERATTLEQPAGLDVATDGTVYVADLRRGAVMVYDDDGVFVAALPVADGGKPVDVAVLGDQLAAATATDIDLMKLDGTLTASLDASASGQKLNRPNGVTFTSPTQLAVSDTNNGRIVLMGTDGSIAWTVSSGQAPIGLPRGISVGSDGSLLFADAFRFAIGRVTDEGAPLGMYGGRGTEPTTFEFPNDVDMLQDLALVADKDNGRIQVVRILGWPEKPGLASVAQ